MTQKEAQQRISKLKDEIRELNYEYFVKNSEKRSEAVRDSLKKELIELENEFPNLITANSPTQRVGAALSGKFNKVEHKTRKWSLFDAFSVEDLEQWAWADNRLYRRVKN
jgi:DNA ligase (NAD+)